MTRSTTTNIQAVCRIVLLVTLVFVAWGGCDGHQSGRSEVVRTWKSGTTTVTFSRDGTLRVSGQGAMADYDVSIDTLPWESYKSSITNIIIEEGVTHIGIGVCFKLSRLKSVIILGGVASIRNTMFSDCDSLASLTISGSVTDIDKDAFLYHRRLTSINVAADNARYSSEDGVLFSKNKDTLIWYPGGRQGAYTIPNSVTTIGEKAFLVHKGLTSVTIPNNVTTIGENGFYTCESLTSIEVAADNAHYSSEGGVLFNKNKTILILHPNKQSDAYTIPNSVTTIGEEAFASCENLTSVTIPGSVTSIGKNAFGRCAGLTSIAIPSSVTSIGEGAFYSCTGLTSITIPGSVTTIGESAFYDCIGLTSITIPSGVTSIGKGAFSDCFGLISIDVNRNNPKYCSVDGVLFNKAKDTLILYPRNKQGAYTIPNSVTTFTEHVFYRHTGLTSITIPGSLTSVGDLAFTNSTALKSVTIKDGVKSIGTQAFQECTGLTSITIPSSVTSIGTSAFDKCIGLMSVTIPGSVTSIGERAFQKCTGLTSVTIEDGVESIGEGAFSECTGLTSVTIPRSVTHIKWGAFWECFKLTSITILNPKPPTIKEGHTISSSVDIYVPAGSIDAYRRAYGWRIFSFRLKELKN